MKTLLSLAILSLCVLSCNKNDDDVNSIDGAGLMTVNLVPETTASFAVSGSAVGTPLPYNSYSGGYLSIFPGARTVDAFTIMGLAARNTITFESGKYYSLFLVDTGAALQQVIVQDDFDSLVTTTQSFVRYINAIQGASSTNVTITSGGSAIVNEGAGFTNVSDFKAVDAGDITITVSDGGSVNVSRTITVESQKVYTILLTGIAGEAGDKAPQIKFIVNGTVDGTAGRVSGSAAASSN